MMKFILFGFILLLSAHFSFGQQQIRKNELSVSFFKVSNLPKEFLPFKHLQLAYNIGAHAIYKYRLNDKFYFRTSQSYYKYNYSSDVDFCFKCASNIKNLQEINTSIGIDFRFLNNPKKKVAFYSGIDLTGFSNVSKWKTYESFNDTGYSTVKERKLGIGIQPFSGLSLYPKKRLIISLEASLLLGLYKNRQVYTNISNANSNVFKEEGFLPYSQLFLLRTASIGWVF